jgi:hypothetical protein
MPDNAPRQEPRQGDAQCVNQAFREKWHNMRRDGGTVGAYLFQRQGSNPEPIPSDPLNRVRFFPLGLLAYGAKRTA